LKEIYYEYDDDEGTRITHSDENLSNEVTITRGTLDREICFTSGEFWNKEFVVQYRDKEFTFIGDT